MIAITERQQMVLDFITRFTQTHGYSPTVRDIAAHLGVSSPSGVNRHLEALEKKGWLKKTGASRGIVLLRQLNRSIMQHKQHRGAQRTYALCNDCSEDASYAFGLLIPAVLHSERVLQSEHALSSCC